MVEKQIQTNTFSVFTKPVYSFRRFNVNSELIPSFQYITVANLNVIRYTPGGQWNCLSSGTYGDKRVGVKYHAC